jgi:hypothetical protein
VKEAPFFVPSPFFRFLFHSSSSAFAHVLPLFFKVLRSKMNAPSKKLTDSSKFPASELMRFNFCLDSMPTAPFDMEKKVWIVLKVFILAGFNDSGFAEHA